MRYRGRTDTRPLPRLAHPRQCETAVLEHRVVRHVSCRYYDRCLQLAVERDWPGFECAGCDGFERLTTSEQRRDMHGLAAILAQICRQVA